MVSALFSSRSNTEAVPVKIDAPIEVNLNLKCDAFQHAVSVSKASKNKEEKVSETARSIIRRVAIVLVVGAIFAMTAPWLMPPLFVQEIGRVLFVCILGLLLEYESNKKSKIAIGPYSFEFKD